MRVSDFGITDFIILLGDYTSRSELRTLAASWKGGIQWHHCVKHLSEEHIKTVGRVAFRYYNDGDEI